MCIDAFLVHPPSAPNLQGTWGNWIQPCSKLFLNLSTLQAKTCARLPLSVWPVSVTLTSPPNLYFSPKFRCFGSPWGHQHQKRGVSSFKGEFWQLKLAMFFYGKYLLLYWWHQYFCHRIFWFICFNKAGKDGIFP